MEWEAIVCLTPSWLLLRVLQHMMPCVVASDDGWVILLIPLLARASLNLLPVLWEAHVVVGLKENPNFRFVLHPMGWVLDSLVPRKVVVKNLLS